MTQVPRSQSSHRIAKYSSKRTLPKKNKASTTKSNTREVTTGTNRRNMKRSKSNKSSFNNQCINRRIQHHNLLKNLRYLHRIRRKRVNIKMMRLKRRNITVIRLMTIKNITKHSMKKKYTNKRANGRTTISNNISIIIIKSVGKKIIIITKTRKGINRIIRLKTNMIIISNTKEATKTTGKKQKKKKAGDRDRTTILLRSRNIMIMVRKSINTNTIKNHISKHQLSNMKNINSTILKANKKLTLSIRRDNSHNKQLKKLLQLHLLSTKTQ